MRCWNCKQDMPDGLKYCGHCGVHMNRSVHILQKLFTGKGLIVTLTVLVLIIGLIAGAVLLSRVPPVEIDTGVEPTQSNDTGVEPTQSNDPDNEPTLSNELVYQFQTDWSGSRYIYNENGCITLIEWTGSTENFEPGITFVNNFAPNGQLLTRELLLENGESILLSYSYNADGLLSHLISENDHPYWNSFIIEYFYDDNNNLIEAEYQYPDGTYARYTCEVYPGIVVMYFKSGNSSEAFDMNFAFHDCTGAMFDGYFCRGYMYNLKVENGKIISCTSDSDVSDYWMTFEYQPIS